MARARRTFTKEYKAEVVALVRLSGKSPGQVAKEMDLTETSVRAWVKQGAIDEKRDPLGPLTSEERAENTRLRRELKNMTMERDFLRKAAVGSVGHCNGADDSSSWRQEAERLPRSTVHAQGDHVEVVLAEGGKVQAARKVLAQ